jgi:hypothetical protein
MGRRSREINIVHFSFLDVLFNTIGAVVFIFLIYAVMTNDLVDERNAARVELTQQLTKIRESKTEVQDIKKESEKSKSDLEKIKKEIQASEEELKKAKTDIQKQQVKLEKKDKTINQLKRVVASMDKKGEGTEKDLDQTLMAQWGESGGSEASKIPSMVLNENLEAALVSQKGDNFNIGGLTVPPDKMNIWTRYYDEKNQKIQFLADAEQAEVIDKFKAALEKYSDLKGKGLVSEPDVNYPGPAQFSDKGLYSADTDGDGKNDTTWFDLDSNGKAEKMEKDINGDGKPEEVYFHFDPESRRWKTKLMDTNGDGVMDTAYLDTNLKNDRYEIKLAEFNPKTGKSRIKYEDKNNDGIYDTKWVDVDLTDDDWEEVYSGFDKKTYRWALVSKDTNNDGNPDLILKDTDPVSEGYEEMEVDSDFDGVFDTRWMNLEPNDSDWEAKYIGKDEKTGFWKEVFFDTNGDGKWDVHGLNTRLTNDNFDVLLKDEDGDGRFEIKMEDKDGDGVYETHLIDKEGKGNFVPIK